MMLNKSVAFLTLGCKVNQYETQAISESFSKAGFNVVDFDGIADVYVINTCSVTAESDRKSRQMIRKAKRKNENAVVAVIGCFVQVSSNEAQKIPEADILIGSVQKSSVLNKVLEFLENKNRLIDVSDISSQKDFETMNIEGYNERTRAIVKIEDGCENFCSYCIIPYAKGTVRSKPFTDVLKEVKGLVNNGYLEIVFSGIHLSSYGKDFSDDITLIDLLEETGKLKELKRMRLGSLEPSFITEKNVQRLSKIKNLCPHFHLSLQSGCDETLKRMNRKYNTETYEKAVNLLRSNFPDCSVTTDIIVGFPGETEEEFNQSFNFVKNISFSQSHIFIFSKRPGTKAAEMPNRVDDETKKSRSVKMIAQTKADREKFLNSYLNKEVNVLFEAQISDNIYEGFTPNYIPVRVQSRNILTNKEYRVKISRIEKEFCFGENIE